MGTFVKSFKDLTRGDFQEAGGKAANLGELTRAGFNVPPGFCVTGKSFSHLIEQNQIQPKIDAIVSGFDFEDYGAMETKTTEIRSLITSAGIPEDLETGMIEAIRDLIGREEVFVAVRSSVAVKGSTVSSFPGMMDTYHFLRGEEEIIRHIKMCWASLWTSRATFARHHKKVDQSLGLIAPTVQKMVNPEVAGVLFTANPISGGRDEMVIESNWGLGESVVSGKSMNDFFLLEKVPLNLKDKKISKKTVMVCFDEETGSGRKECAVAPDRMEAPTISDGQVYELGETALKVEALFDYPQDIEWAYQKGELFILQSRNIKNLKE